MTATPGGGDPGVQCRWIEVTMAESRTVTVPLKEEHLRKMVDNHLLAMDETDDDAKIARVVCKLLDGALGLPETPWHDWDDWAKGLE
jgi:hypothetical protein